MLGFILIFIHSIAIIECENQGGSKIIQYPKDLAVQLEPDTKFHSQTSSRYESSNQKLQMKSPKECSCPEKTNIVFMSVDNLKKTRRRGAEGQMVEQPLYVEEPSWVLLSESNTNLMSNDNKLIKQAEQDPFYLARGKKSAADLMSEMMMAAEKRKSQGQAKLRDRQKHSDISDLFHEPFFISRGKKKVNSYDYYRAGSHVNENNRGIYFHDKRNEGADNNGYSYKLSEDEEDSDGSSRGRRDFFDQLLKENDPFYVTRG